MNSLICLPFINIDGMQFVRALFNEKVITMSEREYDQSEQSNGSVIIDCVRMWRPLYGVGVLKHDKGLDGAFRGGGALPLTDYYEIFQFYPIHL